MRKRKELGYTQEYLANVTGLSQKNISKIENGLEEPRVTILAAIAKELHCKITDLIEAS